jgi:hypothetical protein
MLDTKHRMIRIKILSIGSLDTTVVHPREVFREATSASAAAIVLFHNHSATLFHDISRWCRGRIFRPLCWRCRVLCLP